MFLFAKPFLLSMVVGCQHCSRTFVGYSTAKAARTARDRHQRESHGKRARVIRHSAAIRAATRAAAYRTQSALADTGLVSAALAASFTIYVLSPFRRICFYENTRRHLVQLGVPMISISRREGYDGKNHPDMKPCHYVTRFILDIAVPLMRGVFAKRTSIQVVFIMEDDCRLRTSIAKLYAAALAAGDAVGWLAFTCKNNEPRWGSHCVSFTRSSLKIFEKHLSTITAGLPGWDSCLYRMRKMQPPLAHTPPKSLAKQIVHSQRGRR